MKTAGIVMALALLAFYGCLAQAKAERAAALPPDINAEHYSEYRE